jgi:membrane protein implicated in regulation of membrane protease activity
VAHSVSPARQDLSVRPDEPSIGLLVQSAMADVSTLVRGEIELAKSEIGDSVKRAGIGLGFFGAAGALLFFSGIFIFVALAEGLTALGLPRWLSYLIVWLLLVLIAGLAALLGVRRLRKIKKPERTLETLRDLPEVVHREAPGERHRDVPTVADGRVQRRGNDSYAV